MPAIGLFMGTGTGKTITSLFQMKQLPTKRLLVLCPAKVVDQWKDVMGDVIPNYTIMNWKKGSTSLEINDAILEKPIEENKAIVLSLESVFRVPGLVSIINETWCVIVDESHKIKEYGTKRSPVKVTHATLAIGAKTPYKIILTATPTQKDKGGYIDYFTQLKFLGYMDMSYQEFRNKYCILTKIHPIGMPYPIEVISGYKNIDEIISVLNSCCRRYISKFGDFEPQHTKILLPQTSSYAKLSRQKVYKDLDLRNISSRRMAKKTLTSGTITGYDLYKNHLKYEDNTTKEDWVTEFLSDTDECVVIFYKYNVELEILERACRKTGKRYIVINGANKEKYKTIKDGGFDVVLGQFAACGESIDGLQHRSHICIYYAMPESSLEHRQALGRIDRDGQKLVPMYYYLIMEKTIDADIYAMTERKIEFSEETLNKLEVSDEDNIL